MPQFALLILSMLGGEVARRGGTSALRWLLSTGGKSATQKIAQAAAARAATSGIGRVVDPILAKATQSAPAWLSSRANFGTMARNAVEFGSSAAQMGLMTGGMMAAESVMPGLGSNVDLDKTLTGWEQFQGQPNPGQGQQMNAMAYIEQDAQMKHLERALQQAMAAQRENLGGLY